MKSLAFAIALLFSVNTYADYDSAFRQIRRNAEAEREAAARAEVPKYNAALLQFLNRTAAHHGGYAYGPTITQVTETGYYLNVSFGFQDGWECKIQNLDLYCANVGLNEKFSARRWMGGPALLLVNEWGTDRPTAMRFLGFTKLKAPRRSR